MEQNILSASEALYGFCGWLTTRPERTIMSSSDNATPVAALIEEFCKANNLEKPRERWASNLVHPYFTPSKPDFGFDFAITALKNGKLVTRKEWVEKGIYLWLLPAAEVKKEWIKDPILLQVVGDRESLPCLGSIRLKTATGEVLTGWVASQTDMLATDWQLYQE